MTYDWRVRQARRFAHPNASNLAFVFIDDTSVRRVQEGFLLNRRYGLLWPRHLYGTLTHELAGQGAKAIGFDILFSPLRSDHPPWTHPKTKEQVPSDEFFAQESAAAGNVILGSEPDTPPSELFRANAWATADVSTVKDADGMLRRVYAFRDIRIWNPVFEQVAELNHWWVERGVNEVKFLDPLTRQPARPPLQIDRNGKFEVRELLPEAEEDEAERVEAFFVVRTWHMGIALAARELGVDLDRSEVDLEAGRIVLRNEGGVVRVLPVDRQGRLLINWAILVDDADLTRLNVDPLLLMGVARQAGFPVTNAPASGMFKDKVVVVGSLAVGGNMADIGPTPFSKETFYASTHWNVANSVITGRFIRRVTALEEQVAIMLLGLLGTILTWRLPPSRASFWVLVSAGTYAAVAFFWFAHSRFWLPVVLPLGGGLILTHIALVTYRVIFEESERRRVKSVFAKLVSPNVVNELLNQERLALGGARRRITVFFADVRGFTAMTDANQAAAEEYVRARGLVGEQAEAYYDESARLTLETVNLYLATIADEIKRHDGTLDKYIGDCVMGFWGAPTPNERHAVSCVRAAIDAQRAMYRLNQERAAENDRRSRENEARLASGQDPWPPLPLLSLGTGVNSGEAIVGLMGSEAHIYNYTVFGREVNLASRLEGVSGRGRIIIGEATHADLVRYAPDLAQGCTELDPVTPKGFSKPIRIFEVPWRQAEGQAGAAEAGREN